MVAVSIGLWGTPSWIAGDLAAVVAIAATAERLGIDSVSVGEHLAMAEGSAERYPYGTFRAAMDEPFYDPMVLLGGIATATSRIRLVTTILVAPLRPALLLAKEAATLDCLSGGRLDLGIGAGWQREELDAVGAPWERRFGYMDEQVRACRALWKDAPARFDGEWIRFDRLHARPFPVQPGGVPIWYGVPPSPRNLRRIAELGDGWMPMENDPELLAAQIRALHAVLAAAGRDPASVKIRARPPVRRSGAGKDDLDAVLALIPAYRAAGVDIVAFSPFAYCDTEDDLEPVLRRIAAAREQP